MRFNHNIIWGTVLCCCISITAAVDASSFAGVVHFADLASAKQLLSQEDVFTQQWSKFDIDARVGAQDGSREEVFRRIREAVLGWTSDEEQKIRQIIKGIDADIITLQLNIDFPDTIYLIKTTGEEEGGAAAYTRSNFIVIAEKSLQGLPEKTDGLKGLLVHELFHVLSRNNDDFRRRIYGTIGFRECNNVAYPGTLRDLRITNPDAPLNNSYITLEHGGEQLACMMIIYANRPYAGGSIFQYLSTGLMVVDEVDGKMQIRYSRGQPVVYEIADVPQFFEHVGRNTMYIVHPEEILAENFRILLSAKSDVPSPGILQNMNALLQDKH